jgi:hypothetical protein
MATKFRLTTGSDFGARLANEQIRQALHKSQTNLKSSNAKQSEYRGGSIKNEIDFDVPGVTMERDALLEWILNTMRDNYGGPPYVLALDMLADDYEVIDDPASLA